MKETIIDWIKSFYFHATPEGRIFNQTAYEEHSIYWALGLFGVLLFFSILLWFFTRLVLVKILNVVARKSSITWDDHLVQNRVFRSLAHLVPLMFMDYFLSIVFYQYPKFQGFWSKLTYFLIIWVIMVSVNRALSALQTIIIENEKYRDKPIQSYIQVGKILAIGILSILMLSILTNRTPLFFLTSIGAMAAILVLIFKDTILGFIGSIQLATNDIIRIGDWVTMERFGADGDVEAITLSTVKIRNFDKTITTIPTYAFISDSFKNWRGMQESDGRRIKRALYLQIASIQFASPELIEKLKEVSYLKDFIIKRQEEIDQYNIENGLVGEKAINARRMTNIGLFRRYIEYYLRHHPHVNKEMTLMVRQQDSKEFGVPLEVYCFSISKIIEEYENIQADIFDHLFAVVSHFELRIFEAPTGFDMQKS